MASLSQVTLFNDYTSDLIFEYWQDDVAIHLEQTIDELMLERSHYDNTGLETFFHVSDLSAKVGENLLKSIEKGFAGHLVVTKNCKLYINQLAVNMCCSVLYENSKKSHHTLHFYRRELISDQKALVNRIKIPSHDKLPETHPFICYSVVFGYGYSDVGNCVLKKWTVTKKEVDKLFGVEGTESAKVEGGKSLKTLHTHDRSLAPYFCTKLGKESTVNDYESFSS